MVLPFFTLLAFALGFQIEIFIFKIPARAFAAPLENAVKNEKSKRYKKKRKRLYLPTIVNPADQTTMVLIPPGRYLVGSLGSSIRKSFAGYVIPKHKTFLGFHIDLHEITVKQFRKYEPGYDEKLYTGGVPCPTCPAMGIDWKAANDYCVWAKKRLPTEWEWEAAARGPGNQILPWGNNHLPKRANLMGTGDGFLTAAPVGSFPLGSAPFGNQDMIGNVWEWVSTTHLERSSSSIGKVKVHHIVKGGSWRTQKEKASISYRNIVSPRIKNPTFGFRCAKPMK